MHLVGAALKIFEKFPNSVPAPVPVPAVEGGIPLDHPGSLGRREIAERTIGADPLCLGKAHQILLALLALSGLPGLDRPFLKRLCLIGNDKPHVKADHPPEAPALRAGSDGGVEAEACGRSLLIGPAALGTGKARAVLPDFLGVGLTLGVHGKAAGVLAPGVTERRLDRLDRPGLPCAGGAKPVDNNGKNGARSALSLAVNPREALKGKRLDRLGNVNRLGHKHIKREREPRVVAAGRPLPDALPHLLRGKRANRRSAIRTKELCLACKEQLQIVVELGHRAHGRARRAHRARLIDRDRGRHALDPVNLWPVAPVKKLTRIGTEGLDVPALPLGVERVKGKRTLARARGAGNDGQRVRGNGHIEVAQIVLACAKDADVPHRIRFFRLIHCVPGRREKPPPPDHQTGRAEAVTLLFFGGRV